MAIHTLAQGELPVSTEHLIASIPFLDLKAQFAEIRDELIDTVTRVLDSQHFILGPEVEAFEREVSEYVGTEFAVGCGSGSDALLLAQMAIGIEPDDEVITSPFTFGATAGSIARLKARPVFVDIHPDTFNIDERQLEAAITPRTRAIMPVHLFGLPANMDAVLEIASNHHLAVIEDAAQAIGARWGIERSKARSAGSMGVSAAFSFYPTKNLSAYGDAGLVTTNNPEMAAHMRQLRNHGSPRRYVHEELGWNSRLDAIQAAILRVKLKYVEGWNEARRQLAATYDQLFAAAGLTSTGSQPENSAPVRLPQVSASAHHVFHQYVVRAYRREELREFLTARKIGTEIYYPIPLHLQPCFVYLGYREGDFPEAERAAKEVLALPMFPELTEEEQRWVVKSIADFYC